MPAGRNDGFDLYRRDAELLLKGLRSNDRERAFHAAKRFAAFNGSQEPDVTSLRATMRHKHALNVIARENGYQHWKDMLDAKRT